MFLPPGTFIKHLAVNGFPTTRAVTKEDGLEVHWLDLTQLKIKVGHFTPFIVAPTLAGKNIVSGDRVLPVIETIRGAFRRTTNEVRTRHDANFAVLVVGGLLVRATEAFWKRLRDENLALIDNQSIKAIYEARALDAKSRHLCTAFVRSLGYEALSPYQVGRPAYGSNFFGRNQVLQTILAGKRGSSYTIVGNRRIGKTSLLQEVKHRLRLRDPAIDVAYIYGGTINSTDQALQEIILRLDPISARHATETSFVKSHFPAHIHSIPDKQHRQVAVFIDELDHMLEFDSRQNYELLELLRSTFEHEETRIFLAGFRRTREAARRMQTPLFNFTTPINLSRFTREETSEMIIRPLRLLGLDIGTSDLPTTIHRETGGQPELVQIFGKEIVSALESRGKIPTTSDLLTCVLEGSLFREKVLGTFLSNTTPYEELICYLLIDSMRGRSVTGFEFGYSLMNSLLKGRGFQLGMKELQGIAGNLETAGVIASVAGAGTEQFTLSVPQLARYCITMDLGVCIETALERVQTAPDQDTALWGDIGREVGFYDEEMSE